MAATTVCSVITATLGLALAAGLGLALYGSTDVSAAPSATPIHRVTGSGLVVEELDFTPVGGPDLGEIRFRTSVAAFQDGNGSRGTVVSSLDFTGSSRSRARPH